MPESSTSGVSGIRGSLRWRLVGMRRRNADCLDICVSKREDCVTGSDFAHEVIKRVAAIVSIALGRPQVTARNLMAVRLVLVDPPIAHIGIMPGQAVVWLRYAS